MYSWHYTLCTGCSIFFFLYPLVYHYCLHIYPSIYLPIHPSTHSLIHSPIHPFIIRPYIHTSIHPPTHLIHPSSLLWVLLLCQALFKDKILHSLVLPCLISYYYLLHSAGCDSSLLVPVPLWILFYQILTILISLLQSGFCSNVPRSTPPPHCSYPIFLLCFSLGHWSLEIVVFTLSSISTSKMQHPRGQQFSLSLGAISIAP